MRDRDAERTIAVIITLLIGILVLAMLASCSSDTERFHPRPIVCGGSKC